MTANPLLRFVSPDPRHEDVRPIQLWGLRLFYLLMLLFVATSAWRALLTHEGAWDPVRAVAFAAWATYPALDLFKASPGAGVTSDPLPPSVLGDYVGVTPFRLYDSRSRGRKMALGAGTTGEVQVTGQGGVPLSGVTAVALNVTAVGASESTSFTIWPTGASMPDHASLIAPPAPRPLGGAPAHVAEWLDIFPPSLPSSRVDFM